MTKLIGCCTVVVVAVLLSGCKTTEPAPSGSSRPSYGSIITPSNPESEILSPPERTISVQQLAGRLGLSVERDTGEMVTLRNRTNVVTLFPGGGGHVYVNGVSLPPHADLVRVDGMLYVPEYLETQLRAALKLSERDPVRPSTPPSSLIFRHVVVDAGHGGKDDGATGITGVKEKHVNLTVANALARCLRQAGLAVTITRQSDVFIPLDERAAIANRLHADLFVSIHSDAHPSPAMRGFTLYTCRGASAQSEAVAKAVANALDGTVLSRLGIRHADYRVLVATECPAILVELGYLSNRQDAILLANPTVQERMARAIANGILSAGDKR